MEVVMHGPEDIENAVAGILAEFPDDRIFVFRGELGAGKTTLIKALCRELGVQEGTSSPSFSIVNEYASGKGEKVYHLDLYRLETEEEALDIGLEEILEDANAWRFIEWPDRIENLLPADRVEVAITAHPNHRKIAVETC